MTRQRAVRRATAIVAAGLVVGLAACGGNTKEYKNLPRPASPINLGASVSDRGILVSPRRLGGGPVVLVVTNQSGAAQTVTIEPQRLKDGVAGQKGSTDKIEPQGTADLKITLREGIYLVKTGNGAIKPTRLLVGPDRPSAQNTLLLP
jgi:hypothetical protein